jgi:hypothetical protein
MTLKLVVAEAPTAADEIEPFTPPVPILALMVLEVTVTLPVLPTVCVRAAIV